MQAQPRAGCRVVLGSGEEVGDPPSSGGTRRAGAAAPAAPEGGFCLKKRAKRLDACVTWG